MRFVAQDVREIMASLGFRTMDEMVGHVEVWKHARPSTTGNPGAGFQQGARPAGVRRHFPAVHHKAESRHVLSWTGLIQKSRPALEAGEKVRLFMSIRNCNRTGVPPSPREVSKRYGAQGLPADTINVSFTVLQARALAGSSRMGTLRAGKAMRTTISPRDFPAEDRRLSAPRFHVPRAGQHHQGKRQSLRGDRGEVYINGMAGERFAVRNSGAVAVVKAS